MPDIDRNLIVYSKSNIRVAMEKINTNDKQSVVVVNNKMKLLGVITDGDIRRGMLKGFSIEDEVDCVMNTNPFDL